MREGAYDCIIRPVDTVRLLFAVKNAIRHMGLIRENRRLSEDLCRKSQYLNYINTHAAQILLNMVPKQLPDFNAVEVSAIYKSCECVGGDMYDIFALGSKTFFYLFDVCGHGILSAVMTMILKNAFNGIKTLYERSGIVRELPEIVKTINDEMVKSSASSLFATLFVGVYDRMKRSYPMSRQGMWINILLVTAVSGPWTPMAQLSVCSTIYAFTRECHGMPHRQALSLY
jgi:sigma-B regulation protein RsbU (phosphoserine phosphatase)